MYVGEDTAFERYSLGEFAQRIVSALSIQQEADAKDAAMLRWLLAKDGWDDGRVEIFIDGHSYGNGHTREFIDTAMATPTDSEEK